jgi:hypothetical protein
MENVRAMISYLNRRFMDVQYERIPRSEMTAKIDRLRNLWGRELFICIVIEEACDGISASFDEFCRPYLARRVRQDLYANYVAEGKCSHLLILVD